MFNYILINIIFIGIAVTLLGKKSFVAKPWIWSVLLSATIFFDNIIILMQFVDYDFSKTLGLIVYKMPIEDIFYTVMSVILMNGLWNRIR
jgi:lycopene cyclase domain-containing protein